MTTAAIPITDRPPAWSTPPRAAWPVAVAVVLAALLYFRLLPAINGYYRDQVANCGIAIILAVSLTTVNGFTGQFSIGHSGFMAIGGYAASAGVYYGTYRYFGDVGFHGGRLSGGGPLSPWLTRGDGLFWLSAIGGAVLAAAVGWVVGLPSLRLRGDYLAIVTLGFCEIVRIILQGTQDQLVIKPTDPDDVDATMRYLGDGSLAGQMTHLGGALGFTGTPIYATVFWITVAAVVTVAASIRLKYSAYGRAMLSIREDDIAAQAVGVNVTKLKVRAFVFSAFFAGLGGALYALNLGTINAGELGFQKSFDLIIVVVLGGLGSVSGAAIAAIFLTLLIEWLRDPPGPWPWGFVVAAVVVVLVAVFSRKMPGPILTVTGVCLGWQGIISGFAWLRKHGHPDLQLADYRLVLYALLLIVVMIFRPQGLFGVHEIWDYWPRRWRWWDRGVT